MYYLYVKTHNITGLKYLGQTIRDPYKYRGSGKFWIRHIKKYGYDVSTEILLETTSKEQLTERGIYYSTKYNIVSSNQWANLKEETGDGGFSDEMRSKSRTPEAITKLKNNHWAKTDPNRQKAHAVKAAKSRLMTDEIKRSISESLCSTNSKSIVHHNSGKKRELVCCPYCDKIGAKNTMLRWHFNNCKQNLA